MDSGETKCSVDIGCGDPTGWRDPMGCGYPTDGGDPMTGGDPGIPCVALTPWHAVVGRAAQSSGDRISVWIGWVVVALGFRRSHEDMSG